MSTALLMGWLVDQAAGDPRHGHPVAGFGRAASALEGVLYVDRRSAGVLHAALLVGLPTAAIAALSRRLAPRQRWGLLAAVTWTALGGRSLAREATRLGRDLAAGDLDRARRRIPALVGRDPREMDAGDLARAAVESVAENTADAVVAPLLLAAVAGPAGVVAHRCVNTLDAMVGHRCARYARFGWAAARLDDIVAFVPARLTALLACPLAPLVGGSPAAAVRVLCRDGRRHPSPNAGPCEAAFAGALGVRLGGVNRYGDRLEQRGPQGDGPAPAPADVARAVRLSAAVGAVAALLASTSTLAAPPRRDPGRPIAVRAGGRRP